MLAQRRRHGDQHLIAGMMAERVVDRLEMIEIEHQQPERSMFAYQSRALGVEAVQQTVAVHQTGERIGNRLLLQHLVHVEHLRLEPVAHHRDFVEPRLEPLVLMRQPLQLSDQRMIAELLAGTFQALHNMRIGNAENRCTRRALRHDICVSRTSNEKLISSENSSAVSSARGLRESYFQTTCTDRPS